MNGRAAVAVSLCAALLGCTGMVGPMGEDGGTGGGSTSTGGGTATGGGLSTGGGTSSGGGTGTGGGVSTGGGSATGGGTSTGGGTATGGGSAAGGGSATCDGGSCNTIPPGLLDPSYTTTWNPGILSDVPTGNALGIDGLPVRTTVCASVGAMSGDATAAIQNALDGCTGKHQVVALAAGTYSVSATLTIPSGVVLRGAGSDAASGTTLVSTNGGPVVQIGTMQDGVCYDGSGFDSSAKPLLTADAPKETATVTVASASNLHVGDLALIDQLDDSEIDEGDCTSTFKRAANYGAGQRVEIASLAGNVVTLTTALHWSFKTSQSARFSRVSQPATKWAGLESVLLQGGRPGGYPGQNAGGVDVSNAAYSWVKDVQIDGTTSGMPIRLAGTYRCVVRDSHIHNSYSYGFGQDNYGIVLACSAADNLIENNISRFLDKPIMFNNSGGGNVIGYNYADNSWSCDGNNDDGFQETNIDCHCAFPHMELMEGNWAPHMGASTTHGNAGYLTYFRNYGSSQWSPSVTGQPTSAIVWSQPFAPQYANVGALQFDSPDLKMTVVGNVLGSTSNNALGLPADLGTTGTGPSQPATTSLYTTTGGDPAIYLVDTSTVSWSTAWLHGNFDTANQQVMWNASPPTMNLPMSTRALPASLYYSSRPGWWPAGKPWPWVGPDLSPMVGELPAKARSAAFNYVNNSDPSCTLDCANYCCRAGNACTL